MGMRVNFDMGKVDGHEVEESKEGSEEERSESGGEA
jgi:hypothetical protein